MSRRSRRLTKSATPLFVMAAMALLALLLAGAHAAMASGASAGASPLGTWKTFDDRTGQARAIVRVYEERGRLFGRIVQTFTPGGETRVCVPCTDERKDQPIIGLVIIRNIEENDADYSGGDILDPESGTVYRCKLRLEDGGARMIVRGYLGFALLGRSQVWQRLE